jgi:hypothetical protein
MGMTEAEFWRTAPRVWQWQIEAFMRKEMRMYVRGLHVGAGSKGDYTPLKVVESLRIYSSSSNPDALDKIDMSDEELQDLTNLINKKKV